MTTPTQIELRSDTAANWTSNNPVLAQGEIGVVSGSNPQPFKVGDGVTTWTSLPLAVSGQVVTQQAGATYAFALADAGTVVESTYATGATFTIPLNSSVGFGVPTEITALDGPGSGVLTVTGAAGVTVNGVSGGSVATTGAYQAITLIQTAANTWVGTTGSAGGLSNPVTVPEGGTGATTVGAAQTALGIPPLISAAIAAAQSTAPVMRATTGAPIVLATDQVGYFAFDASEAVMYGPLTGTLTIGQGWNGGTSSAIINQFVTESLTITHASQTVATGWSGTAVTFTPAAVGNLLVLTFLDFSGATPLSSVTTSGTGTTTTWTKQAGEVSIWDTEVWTAEVLTGGSITVTIAGGVTGWDWVIDEFHCAKGATTTWTPVAAGALGNSASLSIAFPSLASTDVGQQVYCGGCMCISTPTYANGTPTGFVYDQPAPNYTPVFAYNLNVTARGSVSATVTQSSSSNPSTSAAVIMSAS